MRFIKTILALAIVAGAVGGALPAEAQIPTKALDGPQRTFDFAIDNFHNGNANGVAETSSAAYAVGLGGTVLSVDMSGTTAFIRSSTNTAGTFRPPPYAAKLRLEFYDSGSNNTISCGYGSGTTRGGTLRGVDQFGQEREELNIRFSETTGYTTRYAYERLTYLSFPSGTCAAGGASDVLLVSVGHAVATPFRIAALSNIISICQYESFRDGIATLEERCIDGRATGLVLDVFASTIDFTAATFDGNASDNRRRYRVKGRGTTY